MNLIKNKYFFLINSIMFIFVFGSLSLVLKFEKHLVKTNLNYIVKNLSRATIIFARIELAQNKSYFNYHHYFFSLDFWYNNKNYKILKKVSPEIFFKYKEGNQIEAIVIENMWKNPQIYLFPQIEEEIQLDKAKYKNLEEISNFFFFLGILFLFFYFLTNYKKKSSHSYGKKS